jgi:hypothetical protein
MKRSPLVLGTTAAALAISLGVLFLIRTPHIPSTIGDEEYGVYSEWTISHFSKNPPQEPLYLLSRTFKFNPFEQPSGCSHTMIQKAGVAGSLIRQLGELGDAEFLFKDNSAVGLHIPWKYKLTDSSPDLPPGTFHLLAFSRVAFSRDRRQALFAVSDACAGGDCGKGGAVYALKSNGTWTFKSAGCIWMY